jgi:hypothetical protein
MLELEKVSCSPEEDVGRWPCPPICYPTCGPIVICLPDPEP